MKEHSLRLIRSQKQDDAICLTGHSLNFGLGWHMRFIPYDSIETYSFVSHGLEIYTVT